jgi:PAS domain S-box-containing protein
MNPKIQVRPATKASALPPPADELAAFDRTQAFIREMDGTIRRWTHGSEQLYGYTAAEAVGLRSHDLLKTQFPIPLADILQILETTGRWEGELQHQAKSGALVTVASQWAVRRGPQGQIASVMEINTDITALKRASDALRDSEAQYRLLAESVPEFVWASTPEGFCDYLNPQWSAFTGRDLSEGLGYPSMDSIHPEDQQKTLDAWTHCVRTCSPYDFDFRIQRHDGVYHWFKSRALPVKAADGSVLRWIGICIDIDDAKRAQQELEMANARMAQANEMLESFAALASHDLQEPLNTLSVFLQLLAQEHEQDLSNKGREYLQYALDSAKRMQQLVKNLLILSRTGGRHLKPEPVNMNSLVELVLNDLSARISQTGALISVDRLPIVSVDSYQLTQVFQNLIANALRYARPEASPRIRISAGRTPGGWIFSVQDNGIGIDPKHFDRIFDPFERLHGSGGAGGSGIGLAICHRAVERHGGRIWVESTPGCGSTFHFTLPAGCDTQAPQTNQTRPSGIAKP